MKEKASKRAADLEFALMRALSERAKLDEQISAMRNTIAGINLGVELQKEVASNEAPETPPEE